MPVKKGKNLRSDFQAVSLFILATFIFFLVAYPFLILALKSFGIKEFDFGGFNLSSYNAIFQNSQTFEALKNTLIIATGITLLSFLTGGSLAWLVARTDFKHKKAVRNTVFLTFTIPSYILGISWLEFFGNNGYLNRIFKLFGLEYTFKAYSITAVIIVMSIHLYPMVFLALSNALKNIDSSLENAAILSGASKTKVFFTVTLPLIMPSLWSVGLFVFSRSMANFGVPALLLMPLYKETLTTGIYRSLNDLDLSSAAAISMILVLCTAIIFMIQQVFTRKKKFTTISTNTEPPRLLELGKKGKWISIIVFTFQFVSTILPVGVLVLTSFMKRWGLPLELKNLTFMNYTTIFDSKIAHVAFRNSFLFGAVAAAIAIVISLLISYMGHFKNMKGSKLLEFIASVPMVIPNIVLAIGAILAWNRGLFNFYGKPTIIIITYTALFLPLVGKQLTGLVQNQEKSLEQAARVSGANSLQAARDILIPFVKPTIKSSWILCMLIALREIPISLMLYAAGTETVGVLLYSMRSNSSGLEATSTVAVLVILLSIIGRTIVKMINKPKKGLKLNDTSEVL